MFGATVASLVIGAHLHTFHISPQEVPASLKVTDHTPGLYLRSESGLTVGVVRNSYKRTSFYLAHTWTTEDGRWSLTAGAISGYKYRRIYGQDVCRPGRVNLPDCPCYYDHGKTSRVLRALVAPSVAIPEAEPYIGATPRVALLGKAISFSIEWELR